MAKEKQNFRFHNPNTAEESARYLIKVFLQLNRTELEKVICNAGSKNCGEEK